LGLSSCKKSSIVEASPDPLAISPPSETVEYDLKLVVLGSSSAFGTGCTPIDSSWVNRFKAQFKRIEVVNLAANGYSTYYALPSDYFTPFRPKPDTFRNVTKALSLSPNLVLISFPTNDVASDFTDEEIINNYSKIVSILNEAKIDYLIFSTQPRDFSAAGKRTRLKSLNDKLQSIYASHYYDFFGEIATPSYNIKSDLAAGDGIHLNNKGHRLIFNGLVKNVKIKSFLKL